jgi:hypothetical protein
MLSPYLRRAMVIIYICPWPRRIHYSYVVMRKKEGLAGEHVKAGRAVGAGADPQVGDNERCAWGDERADIIVELGREARSIREKIAFCSVWSRMREVRATRFASQINVGTHILFSRNQSPILTSTVF